MSSFIGVSLAFLVLTWLALTVECSPLDDRRFLWHKKRLSYSLLGNVGEHMSVELVGRILDRAFAEWAAAFSCFTFERSWATQQGGVDIRVLFTNDDDDDDRRMHEACERRFDDNTPAHAFYPMSSSLIAKTSKKKKKRGRKKYQHARMQFAASVHVNNRIVWMESSEGIGSISLHTVLLHEIGHTLGLAHSPHPHSIMHTDIFTNQIKTLDAQHDVALLNRTYAWLCQT